jgi:hypothetical protein
MWKKYGYVWITLGLFVFSLAGHWIFGWRAYVDDQLAHHQAVRASSYAVEMMRDTLENWQSEFLQLLWQVGGLAVFYCYGSPQSREGDERKEEKINAILRKLDPENAGRVIDQIDRRYASHN